MIIQTELPSAVSRMQRFVELYQARTITAVSLIDEVAELATPENIDDLVRLLPPEVKTQLVEWSRKLSPANGRGMVCWPLPEKTTLSFKEWLKRHEAEACSENGGL